MGFIATITGHIDAAEHNVEQVEKRLAARLREVVAEFTPHVKSANLLGASLSADLGSPAPEAPAATPPTEPPPAAPVQEPPAEPAPAEPAPADPAP